MKEGWEHKKLGEVCQINYGTRVVQKKDNGSLFDVYGGGGKTFKVDTFNRENCFIVSRFAMSPKCTRFIKGKFFLNDSGLSVSSNVSYLKQSYVDKFLLANNDVIYAMGKGMAQRNLDMPSFRNLIIPVPPLSEQKLIVEEMDLLSGIIEKQKQQLKELNTLAQSVFYDMFGDPVANEKGWEEILIKDLCLPKKEIKRANKTFTGTDQISYVDISAIDNQQNKIVKPSSFTFKDAPSRAQQVIIKGDIIISLVRPNLNNVALVETDSDNLVASSGFCVLRCKDRINPQFLYNIATKPHFTDYLVKRVTGANYPAVREDDVMSFRTILPPLPLQNLFALKIETIEMQKEDITKSIKETQKLFDYTMDKYFG